MNESSLLPRDLNELQSQSPRPGGGAKPPSDFHNEDGRFEQIATAEFGASVRARVGASGCLGSALSAILMSSTGAHLLL